MTKAELADYYADQYHRVYHDQAGPTGEVLAVQRLRAKALVRCVRDHIPSVRNHLDIGSSTGLVMQHFQRVYGCLSLGVEFSDAYREYSKLRGLQVYSTLTELRASHQTRFDLVTMAHVLEHLPNPVDYLRRLREKLLTKNGRILLEVPNLYAHDSFEVAHLFSFSPHTFRQVLAKAGFALIRFEQHGQPRSHLIPLYIRALVKPRPSAQKFTLRRERGVRFKRQAGLLRRRLLVRLFPSKAWLRISSA